MNALSSANLEQNVIYQRDDVLVIPTQENATLLEFNVKKNRVQRYLTVGGPKIFSQLAAPAESLVRFWYDQHIHSWIVVDVFDNTKDSKASTIFIPDNSTPYVRNGLVESIIPLETPSALETLLTRSIAKFVS